MVNISQEILDFKAKTLVNLIKGFAVVRLCAVEGDT